MDRGRQKDKSISFNFTESNRINYETEEKIYRVLLITMMVIIFIFSNQDGKQSTNLSNFFARIINIYSSQGTEPSEIKLLFGLTIRKYAHIFVYFLLGIFAFGSLYEKKNMWIRPIIAIIICYLYAAIDEFHQYFVREEQEGLQTLLLML